MNNLDKQYTDLLKTILEHGVNKDDRTGTGTKSIFGYTIRHNMKDGFPLLTTKKMPFKTIATELLWFLRGETNIQPLVKAKCNIWNGDCYKNFLKCNKKKGYDSLEGLKLLDDGYLVRTSIIETNEAITAGYRFINEEEFIEKIKSDDDFAKKWGELGPIYGKQWRNWDEFGYEWELSKIVKQRGIDQIQNSINLLKTDPDSRRNIVNAWNVGELDKMVLPPCHYGFQLYTRKLTTEEQYAPYQELLDIYYEKIECIKNQTYEKAAACRLREKKILDTIPKLPERAISLMWNQRSIDTFLGLPFNIASYGLLLSILGEIVNMVPDQLIGQLGDTHLYLNHLDQAEEQIGRELTYDERFEILKEKVGPLGLNHDHIEIEVNESTPSRTREPFDLPRLHMNTEFWTPGTEEGCLGLAGTYSLNFDGLIGSIETRDFSLEGYLSHSEIKAPLSN